jgi:hypothetical protein
MPPLFSTSTPAIEKSLVEFIEEHDVLFDFRERTKELVVGDVPTLATTLHEFSRFEFKNLFTLGWRLHRQHFDRSDFLRSGDFFGRYFFATGQPYCALFWSRHLFGRALSLRARLVDLFDWCLSDNFFAT